jgi:hypothetical protein
MNVVSFAVGTIGPSVTSAYAGNARLIPPEPMIISSSSVVQGDALHRNAAPVVEGRQSAPVASSLVSPTEQFLIDRNRNRSSPH